MAPPAFVLLPTAMPSQIDDGLGAFGESALPTWGCLYEAAPNDVRFNWSANRRATPHPSPARSA